MSGGAHNKVTFNLGFGNTSGEGRRHTIHSKNDQSTRLGVRSGGVNNAPNGYTHVTDNTIPRDSDTGSYTRGNVYIGKKVDNYGARGAHPGDTGRDKTHVSVSGSDVGGRQCTISSGETDDLAHGKKRKLTTTGCVTRGNRSEGRRTKRSVNFRNNRSRNKTRYGTKTSCDEPTPSQEQQMKNEQSDRIGIDRCYELSLESSIQTIQLEDGNPVGSYMTHPVVRFLLLVVGARGESLPSYVTLSGDWNIGDLLEGVYFPARKASRFFGGEESQETQKTEEGEEDEESEGTVISASYDDDEETSSRKVLMDEFLTDADEKKKLPIKDRSKYVNLIVSGALRSYISIAYNELVHMLSGGDGLGRGHTTGNVPSFHDLVNYVVPSDTIKFADLVAAYISQSQIYTQNRQTHFIPMITKALDEKKLQIASYFSNKSGHFDAHSDISYIMTGGLINKGRSRSRNRRPRSLF